MNQENTNNENNIENVNNNKNISSPRMNIITSSSSAGNIDMNIHPVEPIPVMPTNIISENVSNLGNQTVSYSEQTLQNNMQNMNLTVQSQPVQMNNNMQFNSNLQNTQNIVNQGFNNIQPNIPVTPVNNNQQLQGAIPNNVNMSLATDNVKVGFFKKNKNLLIILIVGIILIGVALFLNFSGALGSKKESKNEDIEPNEVVLSDEDKINIVKSLYEEAAVRHIFNETVSYCGEVSMEENNSKTVSNFIYYKSETFHSFLELDNHVKKFMTEELLANTNYNNSSDEVNSYYEEDENLYCNYWNKGGNISRNKFIPTDTTYELVNSSDTLIEAKINAVYSSSLSEEEKDEDKTNVNIEVEIIKVNDNWLINSYEEVEE